MTRALHRTLRHPLAAATVFLVCLSLVVCLGEARAAKQIPIDLEAEPTGKAAEDFAHQIEKHLRGSNFYTLEKKRVPRIALSVNTSSKGESQVVTYSLVISVVTSKCPPAFIGVIFGDNQDEDVKLLLDKLDKAVMTVAKEFNL